jgi:hypothetical protein
MPKPQTSTSPAPVLQPILGAAKTIVAIFCFAVFGFFAAGVNAATFIVTNAKC